MSIRDEKGLLNAEVKDAISELGNICIGRTSITLGKMLQMKIFIDPPTVSKSGDDLLESFSGEADKVAVGILMSVHESIEGAMLFIVEKQFILAAAKILTGKEYEDLSFISDEEGLSAIQELANVMAASYMKELGNYTGSRVFLSPMMVGVDMVGALISFPLAMLAISGQDVVCVDAKFSICAEGGRSQTEAGHIIMIHDEKNIALLTGALGL